MDGLFIIILQVRDGIAASSRECMFHLKQPLGTCGLHDGRPELPHPLSVLLSNMKSIHNMLDELWARFKCEVRETGVPALTDTRLNKWL